MSVHLVFVGISGREIYKHVEKCSNYERKVDKR